MVSSPTQHWTTLGVSWALVKIFTHDLSIFWNRLASYLRSDSSIQIHYYNFPWFLSPTLLYLWQLLGNVSTHKHRLQVDPEVLHHQPVLQNLRCVCEIFHPLLNLRFEWCIVPVGKMSVKETFAGIVVNGLNYLWKYTYLIYLLQKILCEIHFQACIWLQKYVSKENIQSKIARTAFMRSSYSTASSYKLITKKSIWNFIILITVVQRFSPKGPSSGT